MKHKKILTILLTTILAIATVSYIAYTIPRPIRAGQVNLSTGTEPRSLSDIINFTQKSNLAESQWGPLTPACPHNLAQYVCWETALRTLNRYIGTSQVYSEACTKYFCPNGLPVPRDVEIAPPIATNTLDASCGGSPGICAPAGVRLIHTATTDRIFVASQGSGALTVIDANTNAIITTLSGFGGTNQANGVGVNPTLNRVYVAGLFSNNVTVVDGNTLAILAKIPVQASSPFNVAVDNSTNRVFVTNNGSNNVTVIDGNTNTFLTRIPIFGTSPDGIGVDFKTHRVYVADSGSGNVTVIDGSTNTFLTRVIVGTDPVGIAVNPVMHLVYVSNGAQASTGIVSVINATNNAVIGTIPICGGPCPSQSFGAGLGHPAVNPRTNRVYVPLEGGNAVAVADGIADTLLNTVAVGSVPRFVDVNPITGRGYSSNWVEDSISVIGQRPEVREVCLTAPDCLVISSTGSLFPGTPQATPVNLLAISLHSNITKTGTQMTLTVVCDNNTANPSQQCSAFYIEGNIWSPGQTDLTKSPFLIQNAEPYFYLQFHWWDFTNQKIVAWGTWWYGTASNPNWYWGVYWWWRTYVNYYINIWLPWWWWVWHWTYWRYWAFWNTNFPT